MNSGKRAALYLRVSTGEQTTENQRLELERIAEHSGWDIVSVFEDHAVSGAKGQDKRPGLNNLLRGASRRKFDLVAAWSVDRFGRSLKDLLTTLEELHAVGIDLYLHQQGIDTTTPAGKAMFSMWSVRRVRAIHYAGANPRRTCEGASERHEDGTVAHGLSSVKCKIGGLNRLDQTWPEFPQPVRVEPQVNEGNRRNPV